MSGERRCEARIWPSSWDGWGQCPGHVRPDGTCTAYGTQHRAEPAARPAAGDTRTDRERLREAENLARRFHEAYERLAPDFGYETRRESAVPWENVPEANRRLMTAVCAEILPEVAALLDAAEKVRRVEALAASLAGGAGWDSDVAAEISRALDGTDG